MDLDSPVEERIQLLVDPRNRIVLDVLEDENGPLHVEEIAERLVSHDVTIVSASTYEDRLERALVSLHHDRLPKLAEAGVIEYDPAENVAAYPGTRTPVEEWHDGTILDALEAHFRTADEVNAERIGTIAGRESVIRFGRRLADEAEDELFCMYVTPDLLEDECISRSKAAIDRGVRMYVGSQSAAVRDLVRERLPEATIWEPQLDILNEPTYPRIGRLVLADRRRVMLAVLEESDRNGTPPEETALVGEGTDHPLVVLVRELLGPRLDHLDYQSDDFVSELPG